MPEVRDTFENHLDSIESIDRIEVYNVGLPDSDLKSSVDLGTLIDGIFIQIDEVNRLFQQRFKCKLFCTPITSQSALNKATKGTVVNFPEVTAIVGLIINEICHQEIDKLLSSREKGSINKKNQKKEEIVGSINKIQKLLNNNGINYDTDIIHKLRTLVWIRNELPPTHNGGPKLIEDLKELKIPFPINDFHDAARKTLTAFDSCLTIMADWLR